MYGKMVGVSSLRWIAVFSFLLMAIVVNAPAKTGADMEEQMRAQIQKARKALEGGAWTVYTTLEQERAKKPEEGTETLTFSDRRVTTQNLASMGYGVDGSNYSARYEGDVLIWETMQKYKDGKGEALLRGDLKDGVMVGVIDIQPAGGKNQRKVYRFTSQKEKPAPVIKTGTTTAAQTATAAATTKTTTKTTQTKEAGKKGDLW